MVAQLAAASAEGTSATLLISADAGLGKSALLARAIQEGRRAGSRVAGLAEAAKDPAAHFNLARMDEICVLVPSPSGDTPKRLHDALFDAVSSLDRGIHDPMKLGFENLSRVECP